MRYVLILYTALALLAFPIKRLQYFYSFQIPRSLLLLVILALFVLGAILSARKRRAFLIVAYLTGAIAVQMIYLSSVAPYPGSYWLYALQNHYIPLMVALMAMFTFVGNGSIHAPRSELRYYRTFMAFLLPTVVFGVYQYLLNDLIFENVDTTSTSSLGITSDAIAVNVDTLLSLDHIRAVSVFSSGQEFGGLINFGFALCLARYLESRREGGVAVGPMLGAVLLLPLLAYASYCTLTRNCSLQTLSVLLGVIAFPWLSRGGRLFWVSLAWALIGYTLISAAAAISMREGAGYFDAGSTALRLAFTAEHAQTFIIDDFSLVKLIFGQGLMQAPELGLLPTRVFDNTLLDFLLFGGLVGVVFYTMTVAFVDRVCVQHWSEHHSFVSRAMGGYMFSYPLFSLLNISIVQPFALIALTVAAVYTRRMLARPVAVVRGGMMNFPAAAKS